MVTAIAERLIAASRAGSDPRPTAIAPAPQLEVRWRSHVTRWTPRFGAPSHAGGHGEVHFVMLAHLDSPARVVVEAWLDTPDRRVPVLARQSMPCTFSHDDVMVHLDVNRADRRVLSLSLSRGHDRVVYARSDLIAAAGLAGGCYDPPSVASIAARPEVASA